MPKYKMSITELQYEKDRLLLQIGTIDKDIYDRRTEVATATKMDMTEVLKAIELYGGTLQFGCNWTWAIFQSDEQGIACFLLVRQSCDNRGYNYADPNSENPNLRLGGFRFRDNNYPGRARTCKDNTMIDQMEAIIRKEINELQTKFNHERDRILVWLKSCNFDETPVVPFTFHGTDTNILNSITIQIGILQRMLFKLLELKQGIK